MDALENHLRDVIADRRGLIDAEAVSLLKLLDGAERIRAGEPK